MVAVLAAFGLVVGSFLSAWLYRLRYAASPAPSEFAAGKRVEGVWRGRSACPSCGHTLAWYDLLPLLSYLWLRGRCRYCRKPIGPYYPALELSAAVLFGLAAVGEPLGGWELARYLVAIGLLLGLTVYDLRWMELPDVLTLPLGAFGLVASLVLGVTPANLAVAAGLSLLLFGGQYVLSRGKWIGSGDIILGVSLGLLLGWPGIALATLIAYVVGATVAVALVVAKLQRWHGRLPFGPFLALGAVVALRYGPFLIEWLGWG